MSAKFIDALVRNAGLVNDSDLAAHLKFTPAHISKIRHGYPIGPATILRIHEVMGIPVKMIRKMMAR